MEICKKEVHREALGKNPSKGAKETGLGREKLSGRDILQQRARPIL